MARLWSSGFEFGNEVPEWNSRHGVQTFSTTTVRSGVYALRISSLASGTAKGVRHHCHETTGTGPFYLRFYFRYATAPGALTTIHYWNNADDNSTTLVQIKLTTGAALELHDEDGQIGSASSALTADTWYRVEMLVDNSGGAGACVVRARIDGVEFAGATDRSLSANYATFALGGNLLAEANTAGDWFFDDVALNDGAGSFQNSYPGEGEIIHLHPSAAGDNADWTRGGTDSGANWSQVDEFPPNDATDYVESNTAGQIDDYNLGDTPVALESSDVINCVQVGVRVTVSSAAGADPDAVLRIKASAGGTVEESANLVMNSTTWFMHSAQAFPRHYRLTLYDLPGASTDPWTKSALDSAQIGVRETVTDTHFYRVTALWLLVDHKPAAGGGGQTVTVNQATETDLAQGANRLKTRLLAQIAETDLSQAAGRLKARLLGQITESNLSQAIARLKALAVAQTAETDLSQAVARQKAVAPGQVVENDLAQGIGRNKAVTAAATAETDLAQAVARLKARLIGQAAETDLAQIISAGESLLDGLVSWWALNEESAGSSPVVRVDSHGSNDLSDPQNVASVEDAKHGRGAHFVPTGGGIAQDHLVVESTTALAMGDIDFTLAAWARLDTKNSPAGVHQAIIGKFGADGPSPGREYFLIYNQTTDRFQFGVRNPADTETATVTADNFGSPSLDTWYLVIAWHDSVNDQIGIQINNGTPNTAAHTTGVRAGGNYFHLGRYTSGDHFYWNGDIDEAAVWRERVLSSDDRTELWNAGDGLSYSDIAGGPFVISVGQAPETDLAQAVARLKARAAGQVVENDLSQPIGRSKAAGVGQITETDLAQAVGRAKAAALAQALEADVAQAVAWSPKHRLVARVVETDAAFSVVLLVIVLARVGGNVHGPAAATAARGPAAAATAYGPAAEVEVEG